MTYAEMLALVRAGFTKDDIMAMEGVMGQSVQQAMAQPTPQPVQQVMAQPTPQPVQQVMAQPTPQPVQQVMAQPIPQPVQQVMAQPTPQPVQQAMTQPTPQPVQQVMAQPVQHEGYSPVLPQTDYLGEAIRRAQAAQMNATLPAATVGNTMEAVAADIIGANAKTSK